ncbi:MAG: 4Fe-4S binding protein [Firmicutes bacterium]|nr:4Fe-4S binding protein [Bacillota bacterium]
MNEPMREIKNEEVKLQASNIDEAGNVLYLDEERLARKDVGFPPFKNHPNGLGIYNFIKEKVLCMRPKYWHLALKLYHFFIKYSAWIKEGGIKAAIFKKGIMLSPDREAHTSTVVMPLNVDLTSQGEKVIVPMDIIKESLKHATYIAGMKTCLCREANDCEDYPHDMACLFFGDGGKTVVRNGLAVELTYEEACARVDRAAELGLMGQAVWIEVEQLLWGVRNDEMDKFLEICFCCPCCCIALNIARNATDKERHRFHPAGWTAVPDRTKCTGCGLCNKGPHGCPVEAISFDENGKVVIDQEKCAGCGICKMKCPSDVIKIKQTMPMRADLHDYFEKDFNLDIKVWDNH